MIFQGVLPPIAYPNGMTDFFYAKGVLIKDFTAWAQPLRDQIQDNAKRLACEAGLEIRYVGNSSIDKEKLVQGILRERGDHPGLVCILSCVERCTTYKPLWNAEAPPRFQFDEGRCLHYYFYLIDEELGLCFVRVPTWAPFRLEIYCNGHNWLARQLDRHEIGYQLLDNAFGFIEDPVRAQQLSNGMLRSERLHRKLERMARRFCPVVKRLQMNYHWTIRQAEYDTDILFRRGADLQSCYEPLTRTVIHAVKARDLATFLGKKLRMDNANDICNRYEVHIEGTRIRHSMGPASIKIYDKFGIILRIETTINDVNFFPQYREIQQRNGQRIKKWTKMKKSIYSLHALRTAMQAANRRYLEFVSALQLPLQGAKLLDRISRKIRKAERSYRGLNFFSREDTALWETLARGEFNVQGFRNKNLREHLPHLSAGQISRTLKNLRLRGLIKKTARGYKYYLTSSGKQAIAAGLYLKELVLVPMLDTAQNPA